MRLCIRGNKDLTEVEFTHYIIYDNFNTCWNNIVFDSNLMGKKSFFIIEISIFTVIKNVFNIK